jgi:hypothetical protein
MINTTETHTTVRYFSSEIRKNTKGKGERGGGGWEGGVQLFSLNNSIIIGMKYSYPYPLSVLLLKIKRSIIKYQIILIKINKKFKDFNFNS